MKKLLSNTNLFPKTLKILPKISLIFKKLFIILQGYNVVIVFVKTLF